MKIAAFSNKQAMTLIEVLVVIALLVILAGMFPVSFGRSSDRARRIACCNNLRSVGVAVRLYANDDYIYPRFESTNHEAWEYFQLIGREVGNPKVLVCPADKNRVNTKIIASTFDESPTGFSNPGNRNATLSYFYGIETDATNANALLLGDRNITTNGQMLTGELTLRSNSPVSWTGEIHNQAGNVALADGSVQQVSSGRLPALLRAATNETQEVLLP